MAPGIGCCSITGQDTEDQCAPCDQVDKPAKSIEQPIAHSLALYWVANHQRHNVARITKMRDSGRVEPTACQHNAVLQTITFGGTVLQVTNAGKRTQSSARNRRAPPIRIYILL